MLKIQVIRGNESSSIARSVVRIRSCETVQEEMVAPSAGASGGGEGATTSLDGRKEECCQGVAQEDQSRVGGERDSHSNE
jgi:hypothetical protein